MAKRQITIVGLDQIGLSLALAIRRSLPEAFVVGAETDPLLRRDAKKITAFDRIEADVLAACREAVITIVNWPPSTLRETFTQIGPVLQDDSAVLCLTPVAVEMTKLGEEVLPSKVHFMSCHLMLHPDVNEQAAPNVDLFFGAVLCMTPTPHTHHDAIESGVNLARVLGARPYFMDGLEHDGMLAALEGLPGLMSLAALLTATRSAAWPELNQVAGSLFARVTQSALHPALDSGAALALNRADVVRWLDSFLATVKELRQAVNDNDTAKLNALFDEAAKQRSAWLKSRPIAPYNEELARTGEPPSFKGFNPIIPGKIRDKF
jgi:prephenate dehydrogenase